MGTSNHLGADLVYQNDPVLVLLGPTGSGKTGVAVQLAKSLPVELVCMDSMQVYRELTIGNTAPTQREKRATPHHLFGEVGIHTAFSSVDWLERVKLAIDKIHAKKKLPLLIGGTGLYHKLLMKGISDLPVTPVKLRQRLEQRILRRGRASLYGLLKRLDPQIAERLHPNDSQRIQRFLEVRLITGKSAHLLWQDGRCGGINNPVLTIGLSMDRELLVYRIQKRLNEMLVSGWIDEALMLEKMGLKPWVLERGPIGYKLLYEWLDGKLPNLQEAIERIFIATRQYSKRQMTWFRSLSDIEWFYYQSEKGYNLQQMTIKILEFMDVGSYQSQEE